MLNDDEQLKLLFTYEKGTFSVEKIENLLTNFEDERKSFCFEDFAEEEPIFHSISEIFPNFSNNILFAFRLELGEYLKQSKKSRLYISALKRKVKMNFFKYFVIFLTPLLVKCKKFSINNHTKKCNLKKFNKGLFNLSIFQFLQTHCNFDEFVTIQKSIYSQILKYKLKDFFNENYLQSDYYYRFVETNFHKFGKVYCTRLEKAAGDLANHLTIGPRKKSSRYIRTNYAFYMS